jgi:2-phosphosulfolactate phosphatase
MRRIRLFLSPGDIVDGILQGHLLVAIDVLRASTTICQALVSGARDILPVAEIEEAKRLAESLGRENTLLCGEREGRIIPGFDLGNSPLEYTPDVVKDKTLVMCTTNGTALLARLGSGGEVLIAGFVNAETVTRYLLRSKDDVAILCAGLLGQFCLEDAVCGGLLVAGLGGRGRRRKVSLSDGAVAGKLLYKRFAKNLLKMLQASHHGAYLTGLGFGQDLEFASRTDACPVLPVFREGRITKGE